MRCDSYERSHWEHEEELLIERQAENRRKRSKIAESNAQSTPAAFTPRAIVAVPPLPESIPLVLPQIPPAAHPGFDDIYEDVSPIGSNHSFNTSLESDGQAELLQYIEEIVPRTSHSNGSQAIGYVNDSMNAFYESVRSESTRATHTREPLRSAMKAKTSAPAKTVSIRTSPRLETRKITSVSSAPYNPYIGKDYETINDMLHSAYGYQTGGFFAKENFNVREAKKDLIYLKGIKKGVLEDDPDNFMIGLWMKKMKATLQRDGHDYEDGNENEEELSDTCSSESEVEEE